MSPGADPLVVGLLGLATSHPASDAAALRGLDRGMSFLVADEDDARASEFAGATPDVEYVSRATLLAARPALVIVTTPPPEVADTVADALDTGAVCYANKPAAVTHAQVDALDRAVAGRDDRFLTTSTLRLAPGMPSPAPVDGILLARATIRHDVARWTHAPSWQDDPEIGGGLVGTMGLHGIELLAAVVGPGLRVEHVSTSTRLLTGLRSEDTATLTVRWPDGLTGTVDVLGNAAEARYDVVLATRERELAYALPADRADPFGTRATMTALLAMTTGAPPPVSWSESRAVLRALADAVARAHPTPAQPDRLARRS